MYNLLFTGLLLFQSLIVVMLRAPRSGHDLGPGNNRISQVKQYTEKKVGPIVQHHVPIVSTLYKMRFISINN